MDNLDLARWQFAITTVYHFLFVPVTIGLSAVVAWYHSAWVRRRREEDLRLAKFFGKLFTINFALGLVTGIVQEFQFGMNWSSYSRFVGDIFGAPLAMEALLAFFLESTFLGLWIFGWGRIPERLHAACMWIVHVGTLLSAYFILAANSFMQNPVGWRFNSDTGRAELTDFMAVLTNKVQLVTFPHIVTAAYMVGGAMVMAVALWHLRRKDVGDDAPMYRRSTRLGAIVGAFAGNFHAFHDASGRGYRFLADVALVLDRMNPAGAARLVRAMGSWRKLEPARRGLLLAQLERIASAGASANLTAAAGAFLR